MFKRGTIFAAGLAAAVALGGGFAVSQQQGQSGGTDGFLRAVKLVTAEPANRALERRFYGRIAARETVDLSFEVAGEIEVFPVIEGQSLDRGALVAQLGLGPFERAVRRAELELSQAERDLGRAAQLAEQNVTSQVQADDARTARELAEVALAEAREDLEDATLRSPFDALVATRIVPNFTNVAPGQPVVRLHDMSEVRVEIAVPEQLFQQASNFEGLEFFADIPVLDDLVPVELREFDAQTEAIGQTYRVTFVLPELDHPGIIPGASATVIARAAAGTGTGVLLPASAIVTSPEGMTQVLVYDPVEGAEGRGVLRRQDVEVTSETGTSLAVQGLAPGTRVVGAGAHLVDDGTEVRPFEGFGSGD